MLPADSPKPTGLDQPQHQPLAIPSPSQLAQWVALVDELCDKALSLDAAVERQRQQYEEAVTRAASFQLVAQTAITLLADALAQNSKQKRRIAELLDMGFTDDRETFAGDD